MKPVYLDYAATTPVDPRVVEGMLPFFSDSFGNPSSLYSFGRTARRAVEEARRKVAALIGAPSDSVYFTSGGSESDNWIVKGIARTMLLSGRKCRIVTTPIEHQAILSACAQVKKEGAEVFYLPVDPTGEVHTVDLERLAGDNASLVSVMTANNEIGTIEPIAKIGAWCHAHGIPFHTDAVQAAGHIPISVEKMQIDALSLSAHKLYGPKGIGVLYLRRGVPAEALIHGGAQERDRRAGTENTAGIVGLGIAAEIAMQEMQTERVRLIELREALIKGILALDGAWVNGSRENRLPGNVSFGMRGIHHDTLLIRLDMAGFAVSAGSACSAGALEPSHVLLAVGQSEEEASCALRVTLGRWTQKEEVVQFLHTLTEIVSSIR